MKRTSTDVQTELVKEEDEDEKRRRRLAVQEIIGHLSNRSDVDGILILEPQTRSLLKFHFSDRFSGEIFSKLTKNGGDDNDAPVNNDNSGMNNAGIVDQFQKRQDRLKQQALEYASKVFQLVELSDDLTGLAADINLDDHEADSNLQQPEVDCKVNLLRVRSKSHEFVITPDKGYILVIIRCLKG